jgi:hypothetical protein
VGLGGSRNGGLVGILFDQAGTPKGTSASTGLAGSGSPQENYENADI